jgi:murein DD-endopeptidase MepM/ murein hydrolase activator NlpD
MKPGIPIAGGLVVLRASMVSIVAAVLLTVGCAAGHGQTRSMPSAVEARAVESAAGTDPAGVTHVVERGQTLWRIARAYGVELDELAQINRIEDPTDMKIGLQLFIPRAVAVLDVPPADIAAAPGPGEADWVWPVPDGPMLSGFGAPRRTHRHKGVDIGGRHGQPVLASRAGRVVYSGSGMRGYGKTIIVDHGDGTSTLYAHNSSLVAADGQRVTRGQRIARVGKTGNASTDHCHFEIRLGDRAVDPLLYLRSQREARR